MTYALRLSAVAESGPLADDHANQIGPQNLAEMILDSDSRIPDEDRFQETIFLASALFSARNNGPALASTAAEERPSPTKISTDGFRRFSFAMAC